MHKHDFSLVGVYAEGTALASEALRAREAMDQCAICQDEFNLQTLALAALSKAGPARMSKLERARMRKTVHETTTQLQPSIQGSSRVASIMPKLAIAAVGVAVVGFIGSQVFSSQDMTSESFAFNDVPASEEMSKSADEVPENLATEAASEHRIATAEAFAEEELAVLTDDTGAAESAHSLSLDSPVLTSVDGLRLPDGLSAERSVAGVLRPVSLSSQDGSVLAVLNNPVPFVCVGTATKTFGSKGPLDLAGLGVLDGVEIEVFSFGGSAHAFERADCRVVEVELNLDS